MKSLERDAHIRRLFESGVKGEHIAEQVGCSATTVWLTVKRLGLTMRRGHQARIDGPADPDELMAMASRYGHVAFDDADLPNGTEGWICYIADRPGFACATKRAALRSAIATR